MTTIKKVKDDNYHAAIIDVAEHKYVHAIVSGRFSPGYNHNFIEKVADEVRNLGYQKMLVDFQDAYFAMSITEIFQQPTYLVKANIPRTTRVAVVFRQGKVKLDIGFAEDVFKNRGWNIKFVFHIDEAIDWLNE